MLSALSKLVVVSKYEALTARFLKRCHVDNFVIKTSPSPMEVEPFRSCCFVVDVVSSGATAKHNLLKPLVGGQVLESSLCLFYGASRPLELPAKALVRGLAPKRTPC